MANPKLAPEAPPAIPAKETSDLIDLSVSTSSLKEEGELLPNEEPQEQSEVIEDDDMAPESGSTRTRAAAERKAAERKTLEKKNDHVPRPPPKASSEDDYEFIDHEKSHDHERDTSDRDKDKDKDLGLTFVKEFDADDPARLRRQIQDLHAKVSILSGEKLAAEEKAERAARQAAEAERQMSADVSNIDAGTEAIAQEFRKLKTENRMLREQLNDAQSHIFSLQPYRKELTPEEVGQEYDDLVEKVQDWATKFMAPWLDDHDQGLQDVIKAAAKRPGDAIEFKNALHQHADLVHGAEFPETDEDIIASLILRFLYDNIFQTILYRSIRSHTNIVSFIEDSLQMHVEPKRDLFTTRTWTGEAYNALLSVPGFEDVRDQRRKQLTQDLAGILQIFCKREPGQFQWFCENLCDRCVSPAMVLYEKMLVSTHHFYLDINPYIVWGPDRELNTTPEFIDSLSDLECHNVLRSRRAFNLKKLDPAPDKKELYEKLLNVCTVVPALYLRQIGQRDAIKEPVIVRKQRMLVAWGSEEDQDKFVEEGDQPLSLYLHQFKLEKIERIEKPREVMRRGWRRS